MTDKKSPGFPELDQHAEFLPTRPIPSNELPRQVHIDAEMAVITKHHERIAKAIAMFWGHRDCVEYLQQLLLNGGDGFGKTRIGFKHEVVAALMNLIELHEINR
ncbi:MAG: hypothetical protein V4713_13495 [Pseudomonadota bacterium]